MGARFPGEQADIDRALEIGKRWGYGNIITSLQRAWSKMLMEEYGIDEHTARVGALDVSAWNKEADEKIAALRARVAELEADNKRYQFAHGAAEAARTNERQAREKAEAEVRRLRDDYTKWMSEWQQRRCECGVDDACAFARERDEARAELARLRNLVEEWMRKEPQFNRCEGLCLRKQPCPHLTGCRLHRLVAILDRADGKGAGE